MPRTVRWRQCRESPATQSSHPPQPAFISPVTRFPIEMYGIICLFDNADKFVSDRSLKSGVSANDLEIRIANARSENAHQSLAIIRRLCDVRNRELSMGKS